ncbi:LacI family DNA-binding transcriptional regulator [Paraburkholderia sp. D15]|uniref:LacI family DNA-binding transcriptional regulator n=1 Tax=Paraburkholderia sp. D15 TaxID=2880218 RepID=UPI0024799492|nr:LacI family DNA-binding transcriptional regulator [Paraburkholderia sp. D15]WGS48652.1 LacI family DNA-binding transcriptional regulator [Paraburkholderia sp. D15]WKF56527.1 Catabolite control protein A [Paraburkholderia busanensis]
MTPTIKDVAAHAGFSIATVSRAINAPHTVNPVTLDKVRQSIDALNFRPSPLGRQLRGERTRLIGVVLPTIANPVFAECLQGIDDLASAQGYRLMLMTTQYDADRERHAIETLREHRVEGLILTVADADTHPLLDELDRAGLLYVLMHNDTVRRPSVSVDNRLAAYDGVRMLIAHGHRRILMLAGSLAASDRARQRHLGYTQAMQQAGLTPMPALEVDFNADELAPSVLAHLTSGPNRPSALFCSNDLLAMVVMRGLRRARLQIPHDMSILGFDGLAMGELLSPSLASVCAPNRAIGCAAWERLIARVTGAYEALNETSHTLTLPHSLRPGATIATIASRDETSLKYAASPAEKPFA